MPQLIVANWKSHHDLSSALDWCRQVQSLVNSEYSKLLEQTKTVAVVAPPFPLLAPVSKQLSAINLQLAVQDLSQYGSGSYTGAVAVENLKGLPVSYALLGHSERRQHSHETNQDVAGKVQQAWQAGINPIVCLDEDNIESQRQVLTAELSSRKLVDQSSSPAETNQQSSGPDISQNKSVSQLLVAYEPAAAIGSGCNQPVDQVQLVVNKIRQVYQSAPVLYGGSVDADNVQQYLAVTNGVLVGSASLEPDQFVSLWAAASQVN